MLSGGNGAQFWRRDRAFAVRQLVTSTSDIAATAVFSSTQPFHNSNFDLNQIQSVRSQIKVARRSAN
jgi:hypothetical protein